MNKENWNCEFADMAKSAFQIAIHKRLQNVLSIKWTVALNSLFWLKFLATLLTPTYLQRMTQSYLQTSMQHAGYTMLDPHFLK